MIQMEALKSCISDQLQTIENNEARRLARVREGRHVLHKGDGSGTIEAMNRAHSLSSFERVHVRFCPLWTDGATDGATAAAVLNFLRILT